MVSKTDFTTAAAASGLAASLARAAILESSVAFPRSSESTGNTFSGTASAFAIFTEAPACTNSSAFLS